MSERLQGAERVDMSNLALYFGCVRVKWKRRVIKFDVNSKAGIYIRLVPRGLCSPQLVECEEAPGKKGTLVHDMGWQSMLSIRRLYTERKQEDIHQIALVGHGGNWMLRSLQYRRENK